LTINTAKAKERVSKQALVDLYSCINYCAILSGRNGMRIRYHIISCSGIINIKVQRYYRSWSQVIDSSASGGGLIFPPLVLLCFC
jgi:hypothetical protein